MNYGQSNNQSEGVTYSEMDFCLAYYKKTLDVDEVTFCLGDYIIDMPAAVAFGAITEAAEHRLGIDKEA